MVHSCILTSQFLQKGHGEIFALTDSKDYSLFQSRTVHANVKKSKSSQRVTPWPQVRGKKRSVQGPSLLEQQCMHAKLLQPCLTFCSPMDCSPPGSSVHGILQAKILEWVAMPFSRVSPQPRVRTHVSYVSCIGKQVLYHQCHLGSLEQGQHGPSVHLLTSGCIGEKPSDLAFSTASAWYSLLLPVDNI